ncbi:hypothetical protein F5Y18DRAFT_433186 [Xylariaceae sp. FL1019]|nr:hypothetical protein F5Y18DRAFT_433186 [Xylariaceae sp. FL1019]
MFSATKKSKAFRPTVWDKREYVREFHPELVNWDPVFPISQFPPELRNMIWDAALLQESSQRLVLLAGWEPSDELKHQTQIVPLPNLVSPYLSTCVESRERGLRFYYYREEVFVHQMASRSPRSTQRLQRGTVYINPKNDIFLDWEDPDTWQNEWLRWNPLCGPLQCLRDIQKVCIIEEHEPTDSIWNGDRLSASHHRHHIFPNKRRWLLLYIRGGDRVEVNPNTFRRQDRYKILYEDDLRLLCQKGWGGVPDYIRLCNENHRLARLVDDPEQEIQPDKRIEVLNPSEAATAFDDKPEKSTKTPLPEPPGTYISDMSIPAGSMQGWGYM